jgi:hypothetical protein
MVEAQRRAMEIKRRELEVVAKRKRAMLDRATLLEKNIISPILNNSCGRR